MGFILLVSLALNLSCTSAMLPNYSPAVRGDLQTRDEIIRDYFDLGLTAPEIASFLAGSPNLESGIRNYPQFAGIEIYRLSVDPLIMF